MFLRTVSVKKHQTNLKIRSKGGFLWESKNLVICDQEEAYAQALGLYLMQRKELSLTVQVCSDMEHVRKLAEHTPIDLLILPDSCREEEWEQAQAGQVFLLSAAPAQTEEGKVPRIYKYQSGEKILGEMLRHCRDLQEEGTLFCKPGSKSKAEVIGVFSPVHRVGKTTFALKLGEELSRNSNVLYLNLEPFAGLGDLFEEGEDTLADLLYFVGQEKGNLGLALTMMVKHKGELDYILPVAVSEDLKSVPVTLWTDLIRKIFAESIYETLLLDIDDGIPGVCELLRACTTLYVLKDDSAYAKAKIRQFDRELDKLGYEDVRKKIQWKEGYACRKQNSSTPGS